MNNQKLSVMLPKLEAISKWGGFQLKTVKGFKKAVTMLEYSRATIHPFISQNIGIEQEIANCGDPTNQIRQSILN